MYTKGYIFIKQEYDHECVIVWERADINDYMDHIDFIFVGTCRYDTETRTVLELYKR